MPETDKLWRPKFGTNLLLKELKLNKAEKALLFATWADKGPNRRERRGQKIKNYLLKYWPKYHHFCMLNGWGNPNKLDNSPVTIGQLETIKKVNLPVRKPDK